MGAAIQALQQRLQRARHDFIQLISVRRTYKEKRDKSRFRELVDDPRLINLSETQVTGATSHAAETLVIAGAGSGKTSLLIGRAKYLVESGRAKPGQILMLAYNADAAAELRERAEASNIEVEARTFHAFGNSLLKAKDERTGVAFARGGELEKFLEASLRDLDNHTQEMLVQYFVEELVPVRRFETFASLTEYANFVKIGIPITLQGERVKSHGEWLIANFLYSNGFKYEYEATYSEGSTSERHRPDFTVDLGHGKFLYIEYFGTDRLGNTMPGVDPAGYKRSADWKREVHAKNRTDLVPLYYYQLVERTLISSLRGELKKRNISLSPKSPAQLLEAANKIGYHARFLKTTEQFLSHVRTQRKTVSELRAKARSNPRSEAFLSVFEKLLRDYEAELRRRDMPDFSELVNAAADQIRTGLHPLEFTHLLVDEYQDISADRQGLIDSLRSYLPRLETTYVGDDWQSIYRFSGSDVGIMRAASTPRLNRKVVQMGDTYRLPSQIAKISRDFILRNDRQLSKPVASLAADRSSGRVVTHWDCDPKSPKANLERVLSRIPAAQDPGASLRVLARYSSNLPRLAIAEAIWQGPIDISTIHAAKGLEADFVVVMDCIQDARGFPSTIEDDEVMGLVLSEPEKYPYAEERRLFYVALTRARREVHLVTSASYPSLFTLELLNERQGEHVGLDSEHLNACPACGSGALLVGKATGASYCSNTPFCDFLAPKCSSCSAGMHFNSRGRHRFTCSRNCGGGLTACPSCAWGAVVSQEYRDKKTKTVRSFLACHSWSKTGCRGPQTDSQRHRL